MPLTKVKFTKGYTHNFPLENQTPDLVNNIIYLQIFNLGSLGDSFNETNKQKYDVKRVAALL